MRGKSAFLVGILGIMGALYPVASAAFELRGGPIYSDIVYCWDATMTGTSKANKRARTIDGFESWTTRDPVGISATPGSCDLRISFKSLGDGFGPTTSLASTTDTEMTFDSVENWYDGTSADLPNCNSTYITDFWGIAAHEWGHLWGSTDILSTGNVLAPNGEKITMYANPYSCYEPEYSTLTSDDEAMLLYTQTGKGNYVPNFSFERGGSDTIRNPHVPTYYWQRTSTAWPRACPGVGNGPHHGSCYQRVTGSGDTWTLVRRYMCDGGGGGDPCTGTFLFWANHRGVGTKLINFSVYDRSGGGGLRATGSCVLFAQTWSPCSVSYTPFRIDQDRLYEFRVNNPNSTEMWLDDVHTDDTP